MCSSVNVVKNELRLGKLVSKYQATKQQLEDLTDAWTQSLRRKKKVVRKLVKINTKGDPSAAERWGAGKQKVDEMNYKMWLLDDLQSKIEAEQKRANCEVRSLRLQCSHTCTLARRWMICRARSTHSPTARATCRSRRQRS